MHSQQIPAGARLRWIGPLLSERPTWLRYSVGIALPLLAATLRLLLVPLLGVQAPLLGFVIAIYLTAYVAGFGPALLATATSAVLGQFLFASLEGGDQIVAWSLRQTLLIGGGVFICLIVRELQQTARAQYIALSEAQEANAQLRAAEHRRRSAAQALREALESLSVALRAGRAGSFEWSAAEGMSRMSSEFAELHGFSSNEADSGAAHWLANVEPEDRERVRAALAQAPVDGDVTIDYRIRRHDTGEIRWMHCRGRLIRGLEDSTERLIGTSVDVTELKRAELAHRDSEERLQLVTDHLPALVAHVDRDSCFLFANAALADWFGVDARAIQGRHLREILGEEILQKRLPHIDAVLRGDVVHIQSALPHHRLGVRECEITYVPDVRPDCEVRGFYVMVQDVTERVTAERALAERERRKDDFLAMLAHELRNPIAPIRNVANILSSGHVHATAEVRSLGELLVRQTGQLSHLVDDLLEAARITRGLIDLRPEPVMLSAAIQTSIETMQPLITLKHQIVTHEPPERAIAVDADPVRLRQVFENLLSNAIKFSQERATIRLFYTVADDSVLVHVKDDGAGIDRELLPNIFDLFMQGDRSLDRTQGGLGIGLTIVKHLVELHRGSVEARSAGLTKGSEFIVRLPIAALAEAPRPNPSLPLAAQRRRILIVEDNADSAQSLRLLLELAKHEVHVAYDGAAALERLRGLQVDIVLLDIGLPDMDGYQVAQEMRRIFVDRNMRIYALTGYGREEDQSLAAAAGFDLHLTKPVDPAALLALLGPPLPSGDLKTV